MPGRLSIGQARPVGAPGRQRLSGARVIDRDIVQRHRDDADRALFGTGGLIALHPRPPLPGQDTEARDAEIAIAARRAARARLPVLAIGDFNDVAWSHTSQLFKRVGGYLDPRIGRGTFATFPARTPLLGWPLDHMFVTPEFAVRDLKVLEDVGSDHLPVHACLCLTGRPSDSKRPDLVSQEDRRDVKEVLKEYREEKRRP